MHAEKNGSENIYRLETHGVQIMVEVRSHDCGDGAGAHWSGRSVAT